MRRTVQKRLAPYLYSIISALVALNSIAAIASPFNPAKPVATPAPQLHFERAAPFVQFAEPTVNGATTVHVTFAVIPAHAATPEHALGRQ